MKEILPSIREDISEIQIVGGIFENFIFKVGEKYDYKNRFTKTDSYSNSCLKLSHIDILGSHILLTFEDNGYGKNNNIKFVKIGGVGFIAHVSYSRETYNEENGYSIKSNYDLYHESN